MLIIIIPNTSFSILAYGNTPANQLRFTGKQSLQSHPVLMDLETCHREDSILPLILKGFHCSLWTGRGWGDVRCAVSILHNAPSVLRRVCRSLSTIQPHHGQANKGVSETTNKWTVITQRQIPTKTSIPFPSGLRAFSSVFPSIPGLAFSFSYPQSNLSPSLVPCWCSGSVGALVTPKWINFGF